MTTLLEYFGYQCMFYQSMSTEHCVQIVYSNAVLIRTIQQFWLHWGSDNSCTVSILGYLSILSIETSFYQTSQDVLGYLGIFDIVGSRGSLLLGYLWICRIYRTNQTSWDMLRCPEAPYYKTSPGYTAASRDTAALGMFSDNLGWYMAVLDQYVAFCTPSLDELLSF